MRAIVLLLAAALCCGNVRAAVPHQINYQGFLTNPGGTPVNTTVDMVFSLYDDPALSISPHLLYTETQLGVSIVNGVFNVMIGPQQAAQFSLLAFDVPYWLGVKVAGDSEMTPRQPVAAAAYAIRSATTEALAPTATVPASQISGAIGSATSFTGNLAGDVTGPQATTVVALVGGMTAANVAAGANLANAATSGNTFGALVRRDASGNYSANTISTIGGLNLSTTNGAGTQGVINQGGNRLLHSVGNANFFAGTGAGNFGMTGGNNVGVGNAALAASTSGGQNTAGGSLALSANTSGGQNTASGYAAMQGNLTGGNNAAFGASALQTITGGNFNTAVGGAALASVAGSSSNNIGIGFGAGGNLTTGNFNIDIGNAGVAGESNIIRIGTSQTDTWLTGVVHGDGSGLTGVSATVSNGSITSDKLASNLTLTGNLNLGGVNAAARLDVSGSGWFRADANGLPASAAQGVRVFYDSFSGTGSMYTYDYAALSPLNLTLQSPGGNVAIGNTVPGSKLTVAGRIESTIGGIKFPDGNIQTKALANCSAEGDVAVMRLGAWVCRSALGYVDNGDGTVTDNKTGLMWEKKLAPSDAACLDPTQANRNARCQQNTYTWSDTSPFTEPTGTLYSDFLEKLNDMKTPNDGTSTPCFAGYCDWRIPILGELRSIMAAPFPTCATNPCIDAIFGPTQASGYWSSSTLASGTFNARVVSFSDGGVGVGGKSGNSYTRAVRSGR
ncbi:MAG: DUF1566 domain-containing protein [Betaproteobacteria bacterium]|nr:DUF1566 domain-containing protein [Betaproteobacteria bacterium]